VLDVGLTDIPGGKDYSFFLTRDLEDIDTDRVLYPSIHHHTINYHLCHIPRFSLKINHGQEATSITSKYYKKLHIQAQPNTGKRVNKVIESLTQF
jgi:hypothetical protein